MNLKEKRKERRRFKILFFSSIIVGFLAGLLIYVFYSNIFSAIGSFFGIVIAVFLFFQIRRSLKKSNRIKKIEDVFPDFLQLMSSNLRAGMTIDKALLLSSRPEFAPLDEEILRTGKDITVGKNIEQALIDMSKRIKSDKIEKTIMLINSGIRAGGDLAILLDETSRNMRERDILQKKATSNVLMYIIFIFLTVSIFAPTLFSLSNVLVEILTDIFSTIPEINASIKVPFTLSKINLSITFIRFFSIFFIIVIDILAALILGLVSKGEEKEGFKYILPMLGLSLTTFFLSKAIIQNFMKGFF